MRVLDQHPVCMSLLQFLVSFEGQLLLCEDKISLLQAYFNEEENRQWFSVWNGPHHSACGGVSFVCVEHFTVRLLYSTDGICR